ncbi:PPC domain-containing protein [soil metagenome]
MTTSSPSPAGVAIVAACSLALNSFASSPDVAKIMPRGGERGTEVELRLEGNRLGDAEELISYSPGFEIRDLKPAGEEGKLATATLVIPPDAEFGEHSFRLRTRSGISYVRTFFVGPFPTHEEVESNDENRNDSFDEPEPVPFNHTISGDVEREDVDFYSFEAKKGQRISAEIEGMRLGQQIFDPSIALLDSRRFELAVADDTPLLAQDGFFSIIAPEDGTYIIEVRESAYDANGTCEYRLHLGDFPRPSAVFPPVAQAGQEIEVSFLGENIGEITQRVKMPDTGGQIVPVIAMESSPVPDAATEGEAAADEIAAPRLFAPSPNYLRATDFEVFGETEPNNNRDEATDTASSLPLTVHGIISEPDDEDHFKFTAKKDEQFDVQVFARALRSPLDPVIDIHRMDNGQRVEGSDDNGGSLDGDFTFNAPEDGEYALRVRDHLGNGGPDYVYCVEMRPKSPALVLTIPQFERNDTQRRQMIPVPRANRYATLINVDRQNVSGDVRILAESLPQGVTLHAETLANGLGQMPVVFEAAPDAPLAASLAGFFAEHTEAEQQQNLRGSFYQGLEMPPSLNNNKPWRLVESERLPVATTEEVPFVIDLVQPPVAVVQNGKLDLKVVAKRQDGFDKKITLRMLWNPPGIGAPNVVDLDGDQTEATYTINADGNAQTNTWKLAILGESDAGDGEILASTALVPVTVEPPYLTATIEMASVVRGDKVDLVCEIEHLRPFEGKATINLVGLPAKTSTVEQLEFTKDDAQVTFPITTEEEAPTGKHKNLFCTVEIPAGGFSIQHTVAGGSTLRIDNPPPAPEPEAEAEAEAEQEKVAQK